MVKVGKLDWAANVGPKVVLIVRWAAVAARSRTDSIPGSGIQRFVASIFKRCPVILRRAAFAYHRNLPGGRRTILRVITRRKDLYFLNHVWGHLEVLVDRYHSTLAHETFLHGCAV